jgi:hypothetical protein
MLVAMTYNVRPPFLALAGIHKLIHSKTYLFAAILVGSFMGYYLYEDLEYP